VNQKEDAVKRFVVCLLCIFVTALVVSVAAPWAQERPKRGGILVLALADNPYHYDAHQTRGFEIAQPTAPAYSTLLQFDPKEYPKIIGDLAEKWEISKDGLTYTFKLRPDVHFHDGSILSSSDVKASMERIKNPPEGVIGAWSHLLKTVDRIETPDDLTVVFRLSQPTPSFFTHMASPFLYIYSKAMMERDKGYPKNKIMGTGPFKFKSHVPNVSFELERFNNYFVSDRPYMDGVRFLIIRGDQPRAAALISGRADAELRGLPPLIVETQIEAVASDRVRVVKTDWLSLSDLVFNVNKKPFNDVRIRLAINYAIDIYGMLKALGTIGGFRYIGKWGRPNSFWEMPDDRFQKLPGWGTDAESNRKKARQLLKEAGYPEGLRLKLFNLNVPYPYLSRGVYFIEQLARVGITVDHVLSDTSTWLSKVANLGEWEMGISYNAPPYDDPDAFFGFRIPSAAGNHTHYQDPEITRLYELQSRELDPVKRRELVWQIESRIWENAYWGKGTWPTKVYVLSRRIQNYVPHPTHFTNSKMQDVWLSE
jgi:peptide/nickel transport system substrate-binding protein